MGKRAFHIGRSCVDDIVPCGGDREAVGWIFGRRNRRDVGEAEMGCIGVGWGRSVWRVWFFLDVVEPSVNFMDRRWDACWLYIANYIHNSGILAQAFQD